MDNRSLFLRHIAQTSPEPIGLEMVRAKGIYQYGADGKAYIDFISGFSVANIGHSHPRVIDAVKQQAEKHMHLIVYGEFIQNPQTAYAQLLTQYLPSTLHCIYFTNSGTEATEGALKLAKRATGRSKLIGFQNAYHGSTQGALSVLGDEYYRNAYRPLLPDVYHYPYGENDVLDAIDETTAAVIVEPVQAESGVTASPDGWLKALQMRCQEKGALLIFDEIQSGFGRTGFLWAFEKYGVIPDILLLGKALGGGMPLGAFIADYTLMQNLTHNPVLGHISTFGGHPVSCAAGKAAFEVLITENYIAGIAEKTKLLKTELVHPAILKISTAGLWASLTFDSFETNVKIIRQCIQNGLISDWFLFAPNKMRIAPPLSISMDELYTACTIITNSIKSALKY